MKTVIQIFMKKIRENNIAAYAAQAALFLMLSAIPFLMVLLWLVRFTPVTQEVLLDSIALVSPDLISDSVVSVISEVYRNAGGVIIISLVIAIFSAAKTIQSLRSGLNIAYEVEENRRWLILRLRAMVETFGLIIAVLLLMLLLMFGQTIQEMLIEYFPWIANATAWVLRFRILILFFVLILILGLIYKALPNRRMTFRSQLVGAVACTIAWYVLSFILSIYINYFNGFSFYGSLTSLVLIMFWLYFAMYIFLVCGMLNSSMEMILREIKLARQMKKTQSRDAGQMIPEPKEQEFSDSVRDVKDGWGTVEPKMEDPGQGSSKEWSSEDKEEWSL